MMSSSSQLPGRNNRSSKLQFTLSMTRPRPLVEAFCLVLPPYHTTAMLFLLRCVRQVVALNAAPGTARRGWYWVKTGHGSQ